MSTNADEESCAKRARMESQDSESEPNKPEFTVEYKPSAGNSSHCTSGYTSTNSLSRTATKDTGIMSSSAITAPASKFSSMKKPDSKRALLEIELIQDKIRNQKIKHQQELAHQTEMFDIEYKILLLEYEHKKKMYELVEAEQKAKIDKITSAI